MGSLCSSRAFSAGSESLDVEMRVSGDAILYLPCVIKHVPSHSTDEIELLPTSPAAWPSFWAIGVNRRFQCLQDHLSNLA